MPLFLQGMAQTMQQRFHSLLDFVICSSFFSSFSSFFYPQTLKHQGIQEGHLCHGKTLKQGGKLPGLYSNFLILSNLWDQVRLGMSPGAPQLCLPWMHFICSKETAGINKTMPASSKHSLERLFHPEQKKPKQTQFFQVNSNKEIPPLPFHFGHRNKNQKCNLKSKPLAFCEVERGKC